MGNGNGDGNRDQDGNENSDHESLFETFWGAYPKKVGKEGARKAWDKIKPNKETVVLIINALEWQKKTEQ